MARILLVYASTHGQTAKIAARSAGGLRAAGHAVDLHGDVGLTDPDLNAYDVVIVGASIHRGHHQPELVGWTERRRASLNLHPVRVLLGLPHRCRGQRRVATDHA